MARYDYDVTVIGGGAAGLTASGLAASLGARTALIESGKLGGDCTWGGCVPSKSLIDVARRLHTMRTGNQFGLPKIDAPVDFAAVMKHVRDVRQRIYEEADAPDVVAGRGIDVISGRARFADRHTIAVACDDGRALAVSTRYVVICTGSKPTIPEVPGIDPADILTNETLFEVDDRPSSLLVIGAGPVGVEMGQAFRRLGSRVTIVEKGSRILPMEEAESADIVQTALEREGVRVLLDATVDSAERSGNGYSVQISSGDGWQTVECDKVLVATGRTPNIAGLGLEHAGVEFDEQGIDVNHSCQTSVDTIYACGDVAVGQDFTHVAENMAKTAVTRILLKVPATYEREAVPRVTFTDPECASVGQTAQQLEESGQRCKTIRLPYDKIDRSLIEADEDGVILLHVSPVVGKILGAHIVGRNAGELIHEATLAMHHSLTLKDISSTVHAYPSWSLGLRRAADQWYVQQSSPTLLKIVGAVFGFRGEISEVIGSDDIV